MKKYEYNSLYEKNGNSRRDKLNELGQQGWKLVAVQPSGEYSTLHFRRRVKKKDVLKKELKDLKSDLVNIIDKNNEKIQINS